MPTLEELAAKAGVQPVGTANAPSGKKSLDQLASELGVAPTAKQAPTEKKSVFGRAADAINQTYEGYKNLPVIKQATQAVGGVVGGLGAVVGGVVGGVGQAATNLYEGKPIGEGVVESAKRVGSETAKFGYDIGKEAAAAAPLGGAGKLVTVPLAYGQGYQGGKDVYEGVKEGDTAKALQGGIGLGTSLFGARTALKTKGMVLNPEGRAFIEKVPGAKIPAKAFSGAKGAAEKSVQYGVSQATGLSPDTISQVIETPDAFTKKNMDTVTRKALAEEVKTALDNRLSALKESGTAYEPVRASNAQIKVSPNFLKSSIEEITGVTFDRKGQAKTSGAAKVRDASEVRGLEQLHRLWQPVFDRGAITPNEFLNLRADLAKLSKFERQIGKSRELERVAKVLRKRVNEAYRPQVGGLKELDVQFSRQTKDFKTLSKGILDRDGNFTDTGINRIANATGKGKDILIERLEEIKPGITQKIRVLKAIEDIQNASGQKVGTYMRGGFAAGGVLTGNIPAIIAAILANPSIAVTLLRRYGMSKQLTAAVLAGLKQTVKS